MKRAVKINFRMLTRVMGWLLLIEALFMLVPIITGLIYHERDGYVFLGCMIFTALCGGAMTTWSHPRYSNMGKHEGFLLTAVVWIIFSLFGLIPFMIGTPKLNFTEAFFESMSGFTTTGVSVMADIRHLSHTMHIWRALTQWIGGMGIILFTLAVLPMLNSSGGMQMFNAEVTGITHEKLQPRVSSTAQRLWIVYALLTILLMGLYWLGPMDLFDSICHSFSTMSTGGFSTQQGSIVAWDSLYIKIVTTIFMFIGGVNFALIFKASIGHFREVWSNKIFRTYVRSILIIFVIVDVVLVFNTETPITWELLTIDPLFHIVSTVSSTGYSTSGFEDWGTVVLLLTFVMMFFGACAGSTSGGAKLDRAMIFLSNSRNEVARCLYPNHILSVSSTGKTMPPEIINKVLAFLGLYVVVIFVGALLLGLFNVSMGDSFMAALSCISNTGVPVGASSLMDSYACIPDPGKWVLAILMLTGRLEVFTILVILTPSFWRR